MLHSARQGPEKFCDSTACSELRRLEKVFFFYHYVIVIPKSLSYEFLVSRH